MVWASTDSLCLHWSTLRNIIILNFILSFSNCSWNLDVNLFSMGYFWILWHDWFNWGCISKFICLRSKFYVNFKLLDFIYWNTIKRYYIVTECPEINYKLSFMFPYLDKILIFWVSTTVLQVCRRRRLNVIPLTPPIVIPTFWHFVIYNLRPIYIYIYMYITTSSFQLKTIFFLKLFIFAIGFKRSLQISLIKITSSFQIVKVTA